MFDEIVLRSSLGCKLLPGHLASGRIGQSRACSVVAISQTLDKLVVHDSSIRSSSRLINEEDGTDFGKDLELNATSDQSVYYIAIKDVIRTVSIKRLSFPQKEAKDKEEEAESRSTSTKHNYLTKDLILVGCASSVLIYDATNVSNLLNIPLNGQISAIASDTKIDNMVEGQFTKTLALDELIICGGPQRISALKLGTTKLTDCNLSAEITSERSTLDTITCLAQGTLNGSNLLLTGCSEQKICLYLLDSLDQNIHPCKLTISESSHIDCLCSIYTASKDKVDPLEDSSSQIGESPSDTTELEQMNYFAYGLTSGVIGVYQLFISPPSSSTSKSISFGSERLWRHKCKYQPLSILMHDINGDGLDELVIGFKNGRLEARSPFTGQLLASTRCFRAPERLVGLTVIDYYQNGELILLACSTSGSLIGFKPRFCQRRIPLKGYSLLAENSVINSSNNSNNGMMDLQNNYYDDQQQQQHQQRSCLVGGDPLKGGGKPKTIQLEEQGRADVFMTTIAGAADLHNEFTSDDDDDDLAKPSKSNAKQSLELLQKLNVLRNEQIRLERRACHIYHANVHQASKMYPTDVNIVYNWDFDLDQVYLRLTIVINTNLEQVKLVVVKDESRNLLTSGYYLQQFNDDSINRTSCSQTDGENSYKLVIRMRSKRPVAVELDLKVFCQLKNEQQQHQPVSTDQQMSNPINITRIYSRKIDVPRFSMFTFATGTSSENPNVIRLTLQLKDSLKSVQILDWLRDNFLCFQFDSSSINNLSPGSCNVVALTDPLHLSSSSAMSGCSKLMINDTSNFELRLLDVGHWLERKQLLNKMGEAANRSKASQKDDLVESAEIGLVECKFDEQFCSSLQITYSNSQLTIANENSDLLVDLIQSLVIDRLQVELLEKLQRGEFVANLEPILNELKCVENNLQQLEESERRIQTELYESAEYSKNLMQQFEIALELNEFSTGKELLSEMFMMITGTQNAARAQFPNHRSRLELEKQADRLKEKLSILSGSFSSSGKQQQQQQQQLEQEMT